MSDYLKALQAERERRSMTYADAKAQEHAVSVLQEIVDSGRASEAEVARLNDLLAQSDKRDSVIGKTNATYRGFAHDLSFGQLDTAAGVKSWMQGDGYKSGRDAVREKDFDALKAHPSEFNKGQMAGSGAAAGATIGVAAPKVLQGANWLTKMLFGGGLGSGLAYNQAIQQAQIEGRAPETAKDYWNVAKKNWKPISVGGVVGGGAYPIAAGVGAGVRGVQKLSRSPVAGYGRKASSVMRDVVGEAVDGGADIRRYLDDLTDEAMLVDVPEIRQTGQGLAAQGGTGGKSLSRAVRDRHAGQGARIEADMDTYIGGPNEAFDKKVAQAQERTSVLGPEYDAALASPNRVGVEGVAAQIADQKRNAVGGVSNSLSRVRGDLGIQPDLIGPQSPIPAARMHNVRSELSDDIDAAYTAGRKKYGAQMAPTLKAVDETLDGVPGYADARTGYANNKAIDDAIDEGRDVLSGGRKTATSPREFQARWDSLSSAQKDAVRVGVRRDISGLMGTSKNDAASAWGEFSKEWNEAKLRIVLGGDAEPIIKRLKSAKVFSETNGAIVAGSQTDFRTAARKKLEATVDQGTGQRRTPIQRAKATMIDDPINNAVDGLLYGPRASKANQEIGDMLSAQGVERDAILRQLLAQGGSASKMPSALAQLLVRSLISGSGGAITANIVGNN